VCVCVGRCVIRASFLNGTSMQAEYVNVYILKKGRNRAGERERETERASEIDMYLYIYTSEEDNGDFHGFKVSIHLTDIQMLYVCHMCVKANVITAGTYVYTYSIYKLYIQSIYTYHIYILHVQMYIHIIYICIYTCVYVCAYAYKYTYQHV